MVLCMLELFSGDTASFTLASVLGNHNPSFSIENELIYMP